MIFCELPIDIHIDIIAKYLSKDIINNLCLVNRKCNNIYNDPIIKHRINNNYYNIIKKVNRNRKRCNLCIKNILIQYVNSQYYLHLLFMSKYKKEYCEPLADGKLIGSDNLCENEIYNMKLDMNMFNSFY